MVPQWLIVHIKKIIILADSDDNCTDNYMGDDD